MTPRVGKLETKNVSWENKSDCKPYYIWSAYLVEPQSMRFRLKRLLRVVLNRVTSHASVCVPDARIGQTSRLMGFLCMIIGRSVEIG